jgi:hypothetical protein
MTIEWQPPHDIYSNINPVFFVRVTKSVSEKPQYSYHMMKALNNGGNSKHLGVAVNPSTGKVLSLTPIVTELSMQAEKWIEGDVAGTR